MKTKLVVGALLFFLVTGGAIAFFGGIFGDKVERLTGAHTRVVWMRDVEDNRGTRGETENYRLMGYDSRDGRGVRKILGARGNYFRPLLTPDGRRVVYSKFAAREVWMVDFDGGNLRKIGPGIAASLWRDPATGVSWVYGAAAPADAPLVRYPLDDPSKVETLWTKTPVTPVMPGNLQLSADGLKMAASLPWPVSGLAQLPDGAWTQTDRGCWPAIAPDHSYLSWTFTGSHRHLHMYDVWANRDWKVQITKAPGMEDEEVYHPRWSNHARFMTFSGPYKKKGKKKKNVLQMAGADVDINIGRFNEDFTGIEAWVNVTESDRAEFFPDVWIEGGADYATKFSRPGVPSPIIEQRPDLAAEWPGTDQGLVFLWENNRAGNAAANGRPGAMALALAAGEARFGPNHEMWLRNGSMRVEGFDVPVIAAVKKTGAFTVEFVAVAAGAEGEGRIISLSRNGDDLCFSAGQRAGKLVFRLRTDETGPAGQEVEIAAIEPGRPYRVAVGFARGVLTAWIDGRRVVGTDAVPGGLSEWPDDARLLFGDEREADRGWRGLLEGVAIYDRKITDEEASRKAELYAAKLAARPERPVYEVELELVRRHEPPDLEEISPYRRALVLNLYKVTGDSPVADDKGEVRVAEWVLLEGEEPEANKSLQPGTRRTMRLQRYEDHPQLESERMIGEPYDLDHDLYTEAFPGI
ncbi:MAG: LamG-like jellyroll fold domain-containing protein [Pirellulales bacterium]